MKFSLFFYLVDLQHTQSASSGEEKKPSDTKTKIDTKENAVAMNTFNNYQCFKSIYLPSPDTAQCSHLNLIYFALDIMSRSYLSACVKMLCAIVNKTEFYSFAASSFLSVTTAIPNTYYFLVSRGLLKAGSTNSESMGNSEFSVPEQLI